MRIIRCFSLDEHLYNVLIRFYRSTAAVYNMICNFPNKGSKVGPDKISARRLFASWNKKKKFRHKHGAYIRW